MDRDIDIDDLLREIDPFQERYSKAMPRLDGEEVQSMPQRTALQPLMQPSGASHHSPWQEDPLTPTQPNLPCSDDSSRSGLDSYGEQSIYIQCHYSPVAKIACY